MLTILPSNGFEANSAAGLPSPSHLTVQLREGFLTALFRILAFTCYPPTLDNQKKTAMQIIQQTNPFFLFIIPCSDKIITIPTLTNKWEREIAFLWHKYPENIKQNLSSTIQCQVMILTFELHAELILLDICSGMVKSTDISISLKSIRQ